MKRFQFQLESTLRARLAAERSAALAVAELLRARGGIAERISLLSHRLDAARTQSSHGSAASFDLQDLRDHAHAARQLARLARSLAPALATLEERLASARHELGECSRRRRAIKSLWDRRYAQWRADARRAEQSQLEEAMQRPSQETL